VTPPDGSNTVEILDQPQHDVWTAISISSCRGSFKVNVSLQSSHCLQKLNKFCKGFNHLMMDLSWLPITNLCTYFIKDLNVGALS
jgi:hypothetical protein